MTLDRLSPRARRVIAGVAAVVALGTIALRAFVFRDQTGWEFGLWALQGLAMAVGWVAARTSRQVEPRRGVDPKARRLHW
ncbi:hypothetical protein OWR29_40190 [Actinoplanes sp. Pm04-4]|uniref:Uncharacterized protein n=1 Tax=Paractinoplanes pyxinae TaxID=2997416 RepID=A0ABT4BCL5_9ACTN|nr:hypothetical protein [Actinoplanes pyxinae]MCY1144251.1 hypothetical protein [Actinoplanes pyxinae]